MLPLLLATPWAVEACTTLMVLYIRYGPEIMAALTETPLPMSNPALQRAAAEHAVPIAAAARQAAANWCSRFRGHLSPEQMSAASHVVASTRGDVGVFNLHLRTFHESQMNRSVARPVIGQDVAHLANSAHLAADLFPMALRAISGPRGAQLLQKYGLRVEKAHVRSDFWELKQGSAHIAYLPGTMKNAAQFEHWLEDVLKRHNLHARGR